MRAEQGQKGQTAKAPRTPPCQFPWIHSPLRAPFVYKKSHQAALRVGSFGVGRFCRVARQDAGKGRGRLCRRAVVARRRIASHATKIGLSLFTLGECRKSSTFVANRFHMKSSPIIVGVIALFLTGCVTPVMQTVPFDEAACQWSVGRGSATIAGSAFMKTRGGDVKLAAGNKVELIPETPYTRERFQLPSGTRVQDRDARLANFVRETIADAQGNFEFKNVPAGDYILSCVILWSYGTGMGTATTGGQALSFVSVAGDEVKRVVLTK